MRRRGLARSDPTGSLTPSLAAQPALGPQVQSENSEPGAAPPIRIPSGSSIQSPASSPTTYQRQRACNLSLCGNLHGNTTDPGYTGGQGAQSPRSLRFATDVMRAGPGPGRSNAANSSDGRQQSSHVSPSGRHSQQTCRQGHRFNRRKVWLAVQDAMPAVAHLKVKHLPDNSMPSTHTPQQPVIMRESSSYLTPDSTPISLGIAPASTPLNEPDSLHNAVEEDELCLSQYVDQPGFDILVSQLSQSQKDGAVSLEPINRSLSRISRTSSSHRGHSWLAMSDAMPDIAMLAVLPKPSARSQPNIGRQVSSSSPNNLSSWISSPAAHASQQDHTAEGSADWAVAGNSVIRPALNTGSHATTSPAPADTGGTPGVFSRSLLNPMYLRVNSPDTSVAGEEQDLNQRSKSTDVPLDSLLPATVHVAERPHTAAPKVQPQAPESSIRPMRLLPHKSIGSVRTAVDSPASAHRRLTASTGSDMSAHARRGTSHAASDDASLPGSDAGLMYAGLHVSDIPVHLQTHTSSMLAVPKSSSTIGKLKWWQLPAGTSVDSKAQASGSSKLKDEPSPASVTGKLRGVSSAAGKQGSAPKSPGQLSTRGALPALDM